MDLSNLLAAQGIDAKQCTTAMFSRPVRFSRVNFSYMCMTMSLSSAWIAAIPPVCAKTTREGPGACQRRRRAAIQTLPGAR